MRVNPLFVLQFIIHLGCCIKIFEWQRDWGNGIFTRELAQVLPEVKQIIHSATDTSATYNVPVISLSMYNSASAEFPNGLVAMRPLLTKGNQICFIGEISRLWTTDYNTLQQRHGATILTDTLDMYNLQLAFPGDLDPMSISNIADFCDVDRSHMYYLTKTSNVPANSTALNIQGLFGGYAVVVEDTMEQSIFGINN